MKCSGFVPQHNQRLKSHLAGVPPSVYADDQPTARKARLCEAPRSAAEWVESPALRGHKIMTLTPIKDFA